tara:strand:- start:55 stop:324 length:270 start_codon:yes stop_codon:yes gene_type:complete
MRGEVDSSLRARLLSDVQSQPSTESDAQSQSSTELDAQSQSSIEYSRAMRAGSAIFFFAIGGLNGFPYLQANQFKSGSNVKHPNNQGYD